MRACRCAWCCDEQQSGAITCLALVVIHILYASLAVCCPAVTHSHLDHVGAIEPLKEAYPDLKVIVHETETPYLIGGTDYSCYDYLPKGLSTGFKFLMWLRFIPPFYQYKVGEIDYRWCIQSMCGGAVLLRACARFQKAVPPHHGCAAPDPNLHRFGSPSADFVVFQGLYSSHALNELALSSTAQALMCLSVPCRCQSHGCSSSRGSQGTWPSLACMIWRSHMRQGTAGGMWCTSTSPQSTCWQGISRM